MFNVMTALSLAASVLALPSPSRGLPKRTETDLVAEASDVSSIGKVQLPVSATAQDPTVPEATHVAAQAAAEAIPTVELVETLSALSAAHAATTVHASDADGLPAAASTTAQEPFNRPTYDGPP